MGEGSLISIITVNLNNLEGLKRTMKSVFDQTWQEFEYLIIDGGSTDGSKDIIKAHSEKIDYWVSEPDTGIYNAMNKGISMASGQYLLFLNSGDKLLNSNILENVISKIGVYDIIYFDLKMTNGRESFIRKYPNNLTFSFFVSTSLPHPSTFIRKAIFSEIGLYNENLKIVSDWKFFMDAICKFNYSYTRIPQVLSVFYLDGLSSAEINQGMIKEDREKVLKHNYPFFLPDYQELVRNREIINRVESSRKISFLIKLGFLKPLK